MGRWTAFGARKISVALVIFTNATFCYISEIFHRPAQEDQRLSKNEKKNYFDAQEYVNRRLAIRTDQALQEKNKQFAIDHAKDSRAQLIAYVLQCKEELGHTPNMTEIIGGAYIGYRFDGWVKMLQAADLPLHTKEPAHTARKIYRDELKNQAKRLKEEKAAAKIENAAAKEARADQARELQSARKERDRVWGEKHQEDTDEQLLSYVKSVAADLGQTPRKSEVTGGEYICNRIGSWALICTLAELPLPKELKPPKKKELLQYLNKRIQAEQIHAG